MKREKTIRIDTVKEVPNDEKEDTGYAVGFFHAAHHRLCYADLCGRQ